MGDTLKHTGSLVRWHVADGVGHIVLNRPNPAIALDSATGHALAEAIGRAAEADIGAVPISSTGKQFCAGGDIAEVVGRRDDLDRLCDTAFEHDLRTHLSLEREALLRCAVSADAREGVSAFLDKRPPAFNDRRIL